MRRSGGLGKRGGDVGPREMGGRFGGEGRGYRGARQGRGFQGLGGGCVWLDGGGRGG